MKIGERNREFEKLKVASTEIQSKAGNKIWFELSGSLETEGLRNQNSAAVLLVLEWCIIHMQL